MSISFSILFTSVILLSLCNIYDIRAEENTSKLALIIISTYSYSEYEIEKGIAFYQYLLDEGYDEDSIDFFASSTTQYSDGNSTSINVVNGFNILINNSNPSTEVVIYISDHVWPSSENAAFRFYDGNISLSLIKNWLNDLCYAELTFISLGNHSGFSNNCFQGEDRLLIASMKSNQTVMSDQFDIVRSLRNPLSDINMDGNVTFVEAFEHERELLENTGQNPEIIN